MKFTDDDLKRLKEHLQEVHDDIDDDCQELPPRKINALLARLEAAEKALADAECLESHPAFCVGTKSCEKLPKGIMPRMFEFRESLEAWRKAAGK